MAEAVQASLVVQGGPDSGRTIPLSGRPVTLGRRADNDVVVDEKTVSRRHALIVDSPGGLVLRDLSTTNGTFVNFIKVADGEHVLAHGDRIRLAGSQITFIFRQEGPSTLRIEQEPAPTGVFAVEQPEPGSRMEATSSAATMIGRDSDLLGLLESRRGAVVPRDEIARELWPELLETGVFDQVINQSIDRIRTHLGDDASQPELLITVGGSGFLLL